MNKKSISIFLFFISLLLTIILVLFKDYFKDLQSLGLLGIFLVNFISSATFFVSGPAFLTVIAGGALYNPLFVAIVSSLGASLGDMVSFLFGYSGRNLALLNLRKKFWFRLCEDLFRRHGLLIILIFAILPNPFFDAIGLFAGVFGMRSSKFFIIMLVGRFIRFYVLAMFGNNIN